MSHATSWLTLSVLIAVGGALGIAVKAGAEIEPADPWTAAAVAERWPDPDATSSAADRVGSAVCAPCHEDRSKSLATSFHAELLQDELLHDEAAGCEACHGPGRKHVPDDGEGPIRHPWDAPAAEMVGLCIRCHAEVLTKPVRGHRTWTAPAGPNEKPRACTQCHEIHVDRKAPHLAKDLSRPRDIAELAKNAESIPAERCIECHPGFHPEMARSGHAKLIQTDDACGTCHGPGSLHEEAGGRAELIVDPRRQSAKAVNAGCNSCHRDGESIQRWTCAEHSKEGVACTACHDANAPRGRTLRGSELDLCGSCHLDVKASFRLPNGHDVEKGRVLCSDCHDPHGNRDRVRDKDVRVTACATCHAEKAGPFLHDHGIKRTEGCIACHVPHGSVNRRLLSHSRVRGMCLSCHPETTHDLLDRTYRNCIDCHVEIHGSDLDRLYLR